MNLVIFNKDVFAFDRYMHTAAGLGVQVFDPDDLMTPYGLVYPLNAQGWNALRMLRETTDASLLKNRAHIQFYMPSGLEANMFLLDWSGKVYMLNIDSREKNITSRFFAQPQTLRWNTCSSSGHLEQSAVNTMLDQQTTMTRALEVLLASNGDTIGELFTIDLDWWRGAMPDYAQQLPAIGCAD